MRHRVLWPFACVVALALAPRGTPTFGPDAVWHPNDAFISAVHKSCDQFSSPKFDECMVDVASKLAPTPAIAFARALHNSAFLHDFRETGNVDVGYVVYPFRNQSQGWLLLNGSSGPIDPDEVRRLPEREMKAGLKALPKATLFPGDRTSTIDPVAMTHGDGSQEFIVNYFVQDGCHACDVLGQAFFAWTFDAKGKFRGVRYYGFEKTTNENIVPARPLQVRLNETFTLTLPWNREMEFDWGMEQRPSDAVLHVTDKVKQPDQRVQLWRFAVTGTGTTQMILRYASPKSPDAAQALPMRITAAPALGT